MDMTSKSLYYPLGNYADLSFVNERYTVTMYLRKIDDSILYAINMAEQYLRNHERVFKRGCWYSLDHGKTWTRRIDGISPQYQDAVVEFPSQETYFHNDLDDDD